MNKKKNIPSSYAPFEALVKPARPTAKLGRLGHGIVLDYELFVTLLILLSALLQMYLPAPPQSLTDGNEENSITAGILLSNLFAFALFFPALALTLRNVHNRSLLSLLGNADLARVQMIAVIRHLAVFFGVLFFLMFLASDFRPEPNLSLGKWLLFIPLALPAILIQTSAEELMFRGYLQSQLAARFANPLIWIIAPAVFFGLLHYEPEIYGEATWFVVIWAAAFGIAAADITARSGTLGPAIGFHFCNNVFAILIVSPEVSYGSLSLFTQPFSVSDLANWQSWAPVEALALLNSWLIIRLAIRR